MKKYIINSDNFSQTFAKLMRASFSVYQCVFADTEYAHTYPEEFEERYDATLEDVCTDEFVLTSLAMNIYLDRNTGNGVGWGACSIAISPFGVDYRTGGGLNFGWDVSPEWDGDDRVENTLAVYCYARDGGSLEKSLIEHGFRVER